jgi:choline-sulfatase
LCWATVLGLLLPGLPGCSESVERRPDVLIVVIDTLRSDHCSLYGYERETTPHLDALATRGATFEQAYSPTSTTCPAHATLFTGRHPGTHGLVRNGLVLADDEVTLAELAAADGYRTAGFVSSFPVSSLFGFDQGFEHFDDSFGRQEGSFPMRRWNGQQLSADEGFDRRPGKTTKAALTWLAEQDDDAEPLMLWVHLFDPHAPCEPPERFAQQFVPQDGSEQELEIGRYDAEIAGSDHQLGKLLAAFGERENSLVVVTSDHGEGLWDHGWRAHDRTVYEEELRVPLVFSWPGKIGADRRLDEPVHLVSIAATVAEAMALDFGDVELQGRSVLPMLLGEPAAAQAGPLFFSRPYWPDGREKYDEVGRCLAVRQGRWKYIEAPDEDRRELYDLEQDPREQNNLIEDEAQVAARLSALLADWAARTWRIDSEAASPLSPEVGAGMRALGYVGTEPEGQ